MELNECMNYIIQSIHIFKRYNSKLYFGHYSNFIRLTYQINLWIHVWELNVDNVDLKVTILFLCLHDFKLLCKGFIKNIFISIEGN